MKKSHKLNIKFLTTEATECYREADCVLWTIDGSSMILIIWGDTKRSDKKRSEKKIENREVELTQFTQSNVTTLLTKNPQG